MKPLHQLADLHGFELGYHDVFGEWQDATDTALVKCLGTLGIDANSPQAIETSLEQVKRHDWTTVVPRAVVVKETDSAFTLTITVPQSAVESTFNWTLEEEEGYHHEGSLTPAYLDYQETTTFTNGDKFVRYAFTLPCRPPLGYHLFTLNGANLSAESMLIVTPQQCYIPAGLSGDKGLWGFSSQLYSLNSKRNWGMGDFTDLGTLVDWAAEQGAALVGVNPIHEMFPHNAKHTSPYSPSSREFFNGFYLDVTAIPELASCPKAQKLIDAPEFQDSIKQARKTELVDYSWVASLKRQVLDVLYVDFVENHIQAESDRGDTFRNFVDKGGEALERLAVYQALQEHFYKKDSTLWGWPVWPKAYQSPETEEVSTFKASNAERVQFFQYLQWLVDQQLQSVGDTALERHLPVGLYLDLAVGVDKAGADTWCEQGLYAFDASVGCPPDAFNQLGQNWGLPPMVPARLKDQQYAAFIRMLRCNMKHAGALRIDHALAIYRAFWIPQGETGQNGAYMRYPHHDLLGLIALESQRNHCLVIGEDLGTVPEFVSAGMAERGLFSYKVFFFEKSSDTDFQAPKEYPEQALVTVSTHDLPTLSGFWSGDDIEVRSELDLFPTTEARVGEVQGRATDRIGVLKALETEGLLPEGGSLDPQQYPEMTPELNQAIHRYLARSQSKLQIVQLEDGLSLTKQMNMPGTTDEHPNWCRRLPVALEDFKQHEGLTGLTTALRKETRRSYEKPEAAPQGKKKSVALIYR